MLPEQHFRSTSGRGCYDHRESHKPRYLFFQGAIQCEAPFSSSISLQRIPPLHLDSSSLRSSQYRPGADGVQHPKYVVQLGSLPVRGSLCLHHQKGEKRYLQHVCPYPIPSIGDQPSGFEQKGSQMARIGQGSLDRSVGASGKGVLPQLFAEAFG